MRTIKCQICGKEVEAKNNFQKYCPECAKEKKAAYDKEWRENNREHVRAYDRERYQGNREQKLAKSKEWYENNKEQKCAKSREWYESNKVIADREGNNFCVYIHTDPVGKVYIGRAVGNDVNTVNRQRWGGGTHYRGQKFYDECIAVYGWNNIQHELLEWGLTYEEVIEREQYWIERYNSRNPEYGYNVA